MRCADGTWTPLADHPGRAAGCTPTAGTLTALSTVDGGQPRRRPTRPVLRSHPPGALVRGDVWHRSVSSVRTTAWCLRVRTARGSCSRRGRSLTPWLHRYGCRRSAGRDTAFPAPSRGACSWPLAVRPTRATGRRRGARRRPRRRWPSVTATGDRPVRRGAVGRGVEAAAAEACTRSCTRPRASTLAAFAIDGAEVTNAEFRRFLTRRTTDPVANRFLAHWAAASARRPGDLRRTWTTRGRTPPGAGAVAHQDEWQVALEAGCHGASRWCGTGPRANTPTASPATLSQGRQRVRAAGSDWYVDGGRSRRTRIWELKLVLPAWRDMESIAMSIGFRCAVDVI